MTQNGIGSYHILKESLLVVSGGCQIFNKYLSLSIMLLGVHFISITLEIGEYHIFQSPTLNALNKEVVVKRHLGLILTLCTL